MTPRSEPLLLAAFNARLAVSLSGCCSCAVRCCVPGDSERGRMNKSSVCARLHAIGTSNKALHKFVWEVPGGNRSAERTGRHCSFSSCWICSRSYNAGMLGRLAAADLSKSNLFCGPLFHGKAVRSSFLNFLGFSSAQNPMCLWLCLHMGHSRLWLLEAGMQTPEASTKPLEPL